MHPLPPTGDVRGDRVTVTIHDPGRRRRKPLAVHTGLDCATASELAAVYRALGYPEVCISVEGDATKREAA